MTPDGSKPNVFHLRHPRHPRLNFFWGNGTEGS
jgi:hypothetical protein